jgi:hypothetical protein
VENYSRYGITFDFCPVLLYLYQTFLLPLILGECKLEILLLRYRHLQSNFCNTVWVYYVIAMNAVASKNFDQQALAPAVLKKITLSTPCGDQASNMGGLGSVL